MFPLALVCGNTFVLKPSERDPGAAMLLVKMAQDAGVPDGVLNVIHGQKESVDFICDHPAIRAISFIGSDHVVRTYCRLSPYLVLKWSYILLKHFVLVSCFVTRSWITVCIVRIFYLVVM